MPRSEFPPPLSWSVAPAENHPLSDEDAKYEEAQRLLRITGQLVSDEAMDFYVPVVHPDVSEADDFLYEDESESARLEEVRQHGLFLVDNTHPLDSTPSSPAKEPKTYSRTIVYFGGQLASKQGDQQGDIRYRQGKQPSSLPPAK